MKRRTNLFYTKGPDSKFLTFSNYTEALTGNFLSTDTKMFPDKFLCLKINNLNKTNKVNLRSILKKEFHHTEFKKSFVFGKNIKRPVSDSLDVEQLLNYI